MAKMILGTGKLKSKYENQIRSIIKEEKHIEQIIIQDETKINDLYEKLAKVASQAGDRSYVDMRLNEVSLYIQDKDDSRRKHTDSKLDREHFNDRYEFLLDYINDINANRSLLEDRLNKLENKPEPTNKVNKFLFYYNIGSIIVNALILIKLFL